MLLKQNGLVSVAVAGCVNVPVIEALVDGVWLSDASEMVCEAVASVVWVEVPRDTVTSKTPTHNSGSPWR